MTADPIWKGIALDAETALALLDWQREMGVDEAILDDPVDRYASLPPPKAAAPAPQTAPPPDLDVKGRSDRLAAQVQTLEQLADAMAGFDGLDIRKGARNSVFADGNPAARVMIIGEAPGEEEDRAARPFVGRAGQMLDRMFAAIGLARDAVDAEHALYITNVVNWRPPGNRSPTQDEIDAMTPFLRRHVELAAPDVIVLMGNTPCQAALGRQGITRLRGTWVEAFGRPALPMTHPAYLLRQPIAKREAWADLLSLSARLNG